MNIFERLESEVRGYIRDFPTVFERAHGAILEDENGDDHIDFLAGAGVLNYGHNHPELKKALVDYILDDGIAHGLDLATTAKKEFIEAFERFVLKPRNMRYKLQFPGPTGTNAVEAALKIARNNTGRDNIVCFTNGYHGMTLGSVAATGATKHREAAGVALGGTTFLPYDGYMGDDVDTLEYIEKVIEDASSGVDLPAAVLLEAVQGEGGVNVASPQWLQRLEALCRKHGILMILDDIQAGCGRTGPFFSFERAGITPDIITLSKSLSGFGLPFALVLMKPTLDTWKPGAHNGTFRGNNLAFVTAKRSLELFWRDDTLSNEVVRKGERIHEVLQDIVDDDPKGRFATRGAGMMRALVCPDGDMAAAIVQGAFARGVIIENCGPSGEVVKFLTPLTIEDKILDRGLAAFDEAVREAASIPARKTAIVEASAK